MSSTYSGPGMNVPTPTAARINPNPPLGSACATPEMRLLNDVGQYLQNYAQERPEVAALWCFGVGFILGWRLKPW